MGNCKQNNRHQTEAGAPECIIAANHKKKTLKTQGKKLKCKSPQHAPRVAYKNAALLEPLLSRKSQAGPCQS